MDENEKLRKNQRLGLPNSIMRSPGKRGSSKRDSSKGRSRSTLKLPELKEQPKRAVSFGLADYRKKPKKSMPIKPPTVSFEDMESTPVILK